MLKFVRLLPVVLGLAGPLQAQQPTAAPLPPAPDSLRPVLRAARTDAARQAGWLRVAEA
jgi:hypothetical protein